MRLVITYTVDEQERISVVTVLGKNGEQVWGLSKNTIRFYEKRSIISLVSIETLQEMAWEDVHIG